MQPRYFTVPEFLIERFPSWKREIEREYAFWCGPDRQPFPHTFLEDFLLKEILTAACEGAAERATFALGVVEELLTAADEDLVGATLLSVIDPIAGRPELLRCAMPYMGPTAREWAQRFAAPPRSATGS